MIDIDFFKQFNDTYGHQEGDAALIAVGMALSGSFMRSTDFVARYGGEEFVIMTVGMDEERVNNFANNVVQRVANLGIPHIASPTKFLTISLGFSCNEPTMTEDPESALKRADQALYSAKANGRNRAVRFEDIG